MKNNTTLFTGLLVLGLLCLSGIAAAEEDTLATDINGTLLTDDIQAYDGPIGAGSPLYGLKIAFEDMDESFTTNQTERMDKQIGHSRLRIAEVRRALELNQSDSAKQALDLYWQKMNLTRSTIAPFRSNATGLLHAQEQIVKHQFVLGNLLLSHPNNTGLQRAYNNSLELEEKFAEKTAIKFSRSTGKDNKTILKAIKLEQKEMERHGKPTVTMLPNGTAPQPSVTETEQQTGREKNRAADRTGENQNKKTVSDDATTATTRPTLTMTGYQQQGGQSDDKQNSSSGNNDNSGNTDNKGKGNSQNK